MKAHKMDFTSYKKIYNPANKNYTQNSFIKSLVQQSLEISRIEHISTSSCHLNDEIVEKLNLISTNGPHPLVSLTNVDDMLTNHFEKNDDNLIMTFTKSSYFVSGTVD